MVEKRVKSIFNGIISEIIILAIALTACTPATIPAPTATPIAPTVTPISPTVTPANTPTPDPLSSGATIEVDVGRYVLSIRCFGTGSPVVVLENGLGSSWTYWHSVYPQLPPNIRVCMYDRMGHTSQEIVEDLHALLIGANIEGPYVLLGHSFGGFNVILFAHRYPEDVAGIVLEDSSHPDQNSRLLTALPPKSSDESADLTAYRNALSNPSLNTKDIDWATSCDQVRTVKSLGDIPLIVLTSAPTSSFEGFSGEIDARLNQTWQELQNELALLSSNSTHIVAAKAGHVIHFEEPQLVIDAIIEMVNKVRSK